MVYLRVLIVALLSGLIQAKWSTSQSLDTDLDSSLCHQTDYSGYIIDIHKSIERGADLLDGVWSKSFATCASDCCTRKGCDLALYKNKGLSKTGKNCYYVRCGKLENCVLVKHLSFTTVTFLTEASQASASPAAPAPSTSPAPATTEDVSPPPRTTGPSPSTTVQQQPKAVLPPDHTERQDQPEQDKQTEPGDGQDKSGQDKDGQGHGEDKPGDKPGQDKDGETGAGQDKLEAGQIKQGKGNGNTEVVDIEVGTARKVPSSGGGDECSKYGCDGSGMVAVVVVAVVCFAIVLVVVAIMLKKVVDYRRKRKFRNVDYLINGMYT